MTNRLGFFGSLSAFACLSLLACSSDGDGKRDSAAPDLAPPADLAPEATRADVAPPADQVPAVPDARDTLPPPADTTPAPLDGTRDEREAGGTPVDAEIVDGAPPIDSNPSLDGGAAIDSARSPVPRIIDPLIPQADAEALAADNAAFAFAAYQKIAASADNVVFSPASISIALAMTYAGAAGTTATEMAQALHFNLPPARLHPAFNALDQALAARGEGKLGADDGPMRLNIVNSLWAEQTFVFRTDFLDLLAANYGAAVTLLDFMGAPEPSRQIINAWAADRTEDKIQGLLPEGSIDTYTKLVLVNAVYLNARWKTVFQSGPDGLFTLLDDSKVTVKWMRAEPLSVPVAQGTGFRALSLPYADERLSLLLVVPEAGQFAQVESTLDADGLRSIVASMTTKRVALTMPKFKIETTTTLGDVLQQLGMRAAFSSGADFSGMSDDGGLFIGGAFHKAFIDVGEKGTEAAAVTAVVTKDASAPIIDLYLTVDRPFLYYLRDDPTGAILFMGRVLDPSRS